LRSLDPRFDYVVVTIKESKKNGQVDDGWAYGFFTGSWIKDCEKKIEIRK